MTIISKLRNFGHLGSFRIIFCSSSEKICEILIKNLPQIQNQNAHCEGAFCGVEMQLRFLRQAEDELIMIEAFFGKVEHS